jgi:hypothetical protein
MRPSHIRRYSRLVDVLLSPELDATIRDLVLLLVPEGVDDLAAADARHELQAELVDEARQLMRGELERHAEALEYARDEDPTPGTGDGPDGMDWSVDAATALVIDVLGTWARRRAEANQHIALLLTYAREFLDDPPPLARLAACADMSVSGVRTAYGDRERAEVADRLGRGPQRGVLAPVWRGESSPHGFLLGVDETGSWVSTELPSGAAFLIGAPFADSVVAGVIALLWAQAVGHGWSVHELEPAVAGRPTGEADPTVSSVSPGDELVVFRARHAEDINRGLQNWLGAASPRARLLCASSDPTTSDALRALGRPWTLLRRPSRRHEQFWLLEQVGRPAQRVRLARIEQ